MTLNDLRVGGLQKSLFFVCSGWFKRGLQRIHACHLVINVLALVKHSLSQQGHDLCGG